MKRTSFFCLSLLIVFAATSGADDKSNSPGSPQPVRVLDCQITLIDHVTLASDRSGILKHVEFKEGQSVVSGSQVALIADEVAKANLAVAEKKASNDTEVRFAKVARDAAENEYNMAVESNKKSGNALRAVAQVDIDKARLAADKAALSIQQAEHELALNKLNRDVTAAELKTYSVLAGFDGVITKIYKKKDEAVRQGDPIAEIVNTDRVRIEGRVKLADLPFAKQGAKVLVHLFVEEFDLPEEQETFEGKITFVDLVSDKIDRTTRVFAEVQNRDNILRAGLRAEMVIEVDEQTAAHRPAAGNSDSSQKKKRLSINAN